MEVSHLDKPYWSETAFTKGDVLGYYAAIPPVMLPHLRDRPLTLHSFPEGANGPSFYVRSRLARAPSWLRSVVHQPETTERAISLPLVDDAAGLLWLANPGSIEFHEWAARAPRLTQPDQAIFDLDPGDEATFDDVILAALRLRDLLRRRDMTGYAKTSGRRGLHVVVPLASGYRYTFESVRRWVKSLAQEPATANPALIAVAHGATYQGCRVRIDAAQNGLGRNTAAAYTATCG